MHYKTEVMFNEIEAVCRAPAFQRASKLRHLLRQLGRHTAQNGIENAGQYAIAIDALGCTEDFDPAQKSNVRVQISRLRDRLDQHYRRFSPTEGHRLVIRRGCYAVELLQDNPLGRGSVRRYAARCGAASENPDEPSQPDCEKIFLAMFSTTLFRCLAQARLH